MRTPLILALTLMLAVVGFTPAATAQAIPTDAPATLEIRIDPVEDRVGADGLTIPATVTYCYHAIGGLAMTSTKVTLSIEATPEWATAVVTPSELRFEINTAAAGQSTCSDRKEVAIQVAPTDTVAEGATGSLDLRAVARPNPPIGGAAAEEHVLVKAAGDACHHEAGAEPAAVDEEGTVTAQAAETASAVTPVNAAAVGLGVLGAAVGAVFALRRRGR